jgi:hypothetical protein
VRTAAAARGGEEAGGGGAMNPMTQQFTAIALPIILAFAIAAWLQNRSVVGIHKRLDDIIARLDRIERKLDDYADRIARLEERTSPLRRG